MRRNDSVDASRCSEDQTLPDHAAAHGISNLYRIFNDFAQLRMPERIMLYGLIHGIRPRNVLEVGSAHGGSAFLICGAMDDNGFGRMVCIDPDFRFSDDTMRAVRHRITQVNGFSPAAYSEAAKAISPERFDFAFIDGDHTFDAVVADVEGALPLLADRAHVLMHDANHPDVQQAIEAILERNAGLADCGDLSIERSVVEASDGSIEHWAGFRMLRFNRHAVAGARDAAPAAVIGNATVAEADLDPATRKAMQTLLTRGRERIRELEAECARVFAEAQSVAAGFEERGARVRELEADFRRLWEDHRQLAEGFEERGARIRELEQLLPQAARPHHVSEGERR